MECYAAVLGDCEGPVSREHYISKALLERLGRFTATGLPWADGTRQFTASSMTAKILCARHNNALSDLDATMSRFFGILEAFHAGIAGGEHTINGEHLERWALKVLSGMIASGNYSRRDGITVKFPPPERYLAILFGSRPMPDRWGFYLFRSPTETVSAPFTFTINSHPSGTPEEGLIYGATTQILGLYFATAMTAVRSEHETLWYRPRGLDLGGRCRIELQWSSTPSKDYVRMDTRGTLPIFLAP